MSKIIHFSRALAKDEEGLALLEYTVLLALIAAAAIVTIGLVGGKVSGYWNTFNTNF